MTKNNTCKKRRKRFSYNNFLIQFNSKRPMIISLDFDHHFIDYLTPLLHITHIIY
jgi:hypothetical protein